MTVSIERLLATTPKEQIESRCAEVCALADELFEGSKARFVFILWPDGLETDPNAFAVFAQPAAQPVAQVALQTAIQALGSKDDQ